MSLQEIARYRRPWRELSVPEKQEALAELRRRQQAQVEHELRELVLVRRGRS
jgi:hypothetical protein